jgi:alpha-beta hydrolase superfamily lysophospholipase
MSKPIVLIVHGAWHRPAHFESLVHMLHERGYDQVLVPALPTTGSTDSINGKTYIDDTAVVTHLLLPHLEQARQVIILAHSYGGIVADEAVRSLIGSRGVQGGIAVIYLAAYIGRQPMWKQALSPDPANPVRRVAAKA